MICIKCNKYTDELFTIEKKNKEYLVCRSCLEKEIYKERKKIMKKYKRGSYNYQNFTMGIYGKIIKKKHCRAYCDLHKCYLGGLDIKERECQKKECKHLKQIQEKNNKKV